MLFYFRPKIPLLFAFAAMLLVPCITSAQRVGALRSGESVIQLPGAAKKACLIGRGKPRLVPFPYNPRARELKIATEISKTKKALTSAVKSSRSLSKSIRMLKKGRASTAAIAKKVRLLASVNKKKTNLSLLLTSLNSCRRGKLKPPPVLSPSPSPSPTPTPKPSDPAICEGSASCDDFDPCTKADACTDGICRGIALLPNETTSCGVGACRRSVSACADGIPTVCSPGTPVTEICNGIDDDCDGVSDEGCTGALCTFTSECAEGYFCSPQGCLPLKVDGSSCDSNGECSENRCDSGFCCPSGNCCSSDTDCLALSSPAVCTSVENCQGQKVVGVCGQTFSCEALIVQDDTACVGAVSNTCGSYPSVTCSALPEQTSNQPSLCATSCTTDFECDGDAHCLAGACVPKFSLGVSCSGANQCASGNCVEGLCCNSSCEGGCNSCAVTGREGTCSPVPAGSDPKDACTAAVPSSCGNTGLCDGAGSCSLWQQGTLCGGYSCTSAIETPPDECNGLGSCLPRPPAAKRNCLAYPCDSQGERCATSCVIDTDCRASVSAFCKNGQCTTGVENGGSCTSTSQCKVGFCVSGICCNTPCNTPGHTCANPTGTCTTI